MLPSVLETRYPRSVAVNSSSRVNAPVLAGKDASRTPARPLRMRPPLVRLSAVSSHNDGTSRLMPVAAEIVVGARVVDIGMVVKPAVVASPVGSLVAVAGVVEVASTVDSAAEPTLSTVSTTCTKPLPALVSEEVKLLWDALSSTTVPKLATGMTFSSAILRLRTVAKVAAVNRPCATCLKTNACVSAGTVLLTKALRTLSASLLKAALLGANTVYGPVWRKGATKGVVARMLSKTLVAERLPTTSTTETPVNSVVEGAGAVLVNGMVVAALVLEGGTSMVLEGGLEVGEAMVVAGAEVGPRVVVASNGSTRSEATCNMQHATCNTQQQ